MVSIVKSGRLSQSQWVAGAFDLLCEGGIDALRVEPLATRLGVTKGSFYHHFDNRRSLHLAMLEAWEEHGTSQIIDHVEAAETDPGKRLRELAHQTFAHHGDADPIETAIRSWAALDDEVAAAVTRVDERRISFVLELAIETGMDPAVAERRTGLFYRSLLGEFFWRQTNGTAITHAEIEELIELFFTP